MLLMLAGLPLIGFLILANLLWAALFASAIWRLLKRGAISRPHDGFLQTMLAFFRSNKPEAMRMGAFSAADMYISNFAYFVVPFAFGLGAPTIILDTTFKIYRGAAILYAAGADVAVPRQTRALAERDQKSLLKATLMAAALCSLPALALCGILLCGKRAAICHSARAGRHHARRQRRRSWSRSCSPTSPRPSPIRSCSHGLFPPTRHDRGRAGRGADDDDRNRRVPSGSISQASCGVTRSPSRRASDSRVSGLDPRPIRSCLEPPGPVNSISPGPN